MLKMLGDYFFCFVEETNKWVMGRGSEKFFFLIGVSYIPHK